MGDTPFVGHMPEPLALIDATLLFAAQILIAENPVLLAPPEGATTLSPQVRAARHLLDALRELHAAVEIYRDLNKGVL
jgi:hypothetical protein